jgi:protein-S-isoprenylcysteine O-methyltransferase Ste14
MTDIPEVLPISRKALPPYWFVASLLLEAALDKYVPIVEWIPKPINYVGWLFVAFGIAIGGWAIFLFRRAKTGIVPFSPSSSLVIEGPYQITRNPMYVGMTLALVGWALILGSLTPFFVPPAFAVMITYLFILPEEGHMEKTFGASYLDRKQRVRRWL